MTLSKLSENTKTKKLKVVVYGQGSTEHRGATLLRISDQLREELAELAQGQLYMLVEIALRKYIEELKARPAGQIEVIDAADYPALPPANPTGAKRAPRPKKEPSAAAKTPRKRPAPK